MTYCVAAISKEGIVFASDSRTNAGVDQLAVFSKMNVFEVAGERVICLLSAGNLGTSQSVISLLHMRSKVPDGGHAPDGINGIGSLYDVAVLVGQTLREVVARDGTSLEADGINPSCSFIVGGQIKDEPPRLFLVYPQGNFIEAMQDTTFFQIGERKYGKPMLDRVLEVDTPLEDVAKCILVSFDATLRSNLSVGLPIDLLGYEADALRVTHRRRYHEGDPYFQQISDVWSIGLLRLFAEVPEVSWRSGTG
jgi:putative proteasome-type protease